MVGKEKVHNTLGEVLHHKSLPAGYLKVSIDIASEGGPLLSIPNDVLDATLVGEAISAYVVWSSSLIHVDDEIHAKEIEQVSRGKELGISNIFTQKKDVAKKAATSKKPTSQYKSCLQTYIGITNIPNGGTRLIPMKEYIFGYEYMEASGRENLDQVSKHLKLGLSVIDIYIRFLYDKVMRPRGLEEQFAFLAPNTVNSGLIVTKPDDVIALLQAFRSQRYIQIPKSRANNITWIRVQVIGADVEDRANKFVVVVF
ncbi:uncharacterized protein LOC131625457 [Vicia villosa]|uniref:uncharacterized protein LOC131625457 n=1 Tax=Vicia villosa TaxID=3911 RepID=UPI00273ABCF6|nr:uncharacterized protein LOC131625457 [Vicia villosa]